MRECRGVSIIMYCKSIIYNNGVDVSVAGCYPPLTTVDDLLLCHQSNTVLLIREVRFLEEVK